MVDEEEFAERVIDEKAEKTEEKKPEQTKNEEQELKERYGVIEEIPERILEEMEARAASSRKEPKEVSLPEVLLRVEKLDGKLEILEDYKTGIDERMSVISESIGELRSMILEKEKFLSKVEKDMEVTLDSVSGLETDKIKKQFLKMETEIEETKANTEKLEAEILAVQAENRKYLEAMEKVKSVENLIVTSENIEKKLAKIEETKMYAERVSTKVEAIFSELNEKLSDLEHRKDQIQKMDELTVDIVRMLDEMSIKFAKFVEKDDFENLKDEINKKLSRLGVGKVEIARKTQAEEKVEKAEQIEEKDDEDEVWANLKEKWKNKLNQQNPPA